VTQAAVLTVRIFAHCQRGYHQPSEPLDPVNGFELSWYEARIVTLLLLHRLGATLLIDTSTLVATATPAATAAATTIITATSASATTGLT